MGSDDKGDIYHSNPSRIAHCKTQLGGSTIHRRRETGTVKLLLTAISGSREGNTFAIEPSQCITFGRTSASTWSFEDDGHMSGVHFEVENFGTYGEVRDCGSTNGTWLNNGKIAREQLREGDRIRAGKTVLTVEFIQPLPQVESTDRSASPDMVPNFTPATDPGPVQRPSSPTPRFPLPPNPIEPLPASPRPIEPLPAPPRPIEAESPLPPLNALPRHGNPSIASVDAPPARPINPFDSIDFSEPPSPPEMSSGNPFGPNASVSPSENRVANPISESSFSFQAPELQPVAERRLPATVHQFLERRTTVESADALGVIIDSLSTHWCIQLVLHFQKIRLSPPTDCNVQPLYSWFPAHDAREFGPVLVGWNEIHANKGLLSLLPRLCRADACIAFFGTSAGDIGSQVEQMLRTGVDGFSEENGFLPCCWPSSFAAILDAKGTDTCRKMYGPKISGAVMCTPWDRHKLMAAVNLELSSELKSNGFLETDRFIG